ncbi:MAG: minor capsid protein [Clostridium sp.]|uniref:minor capsid protein n=1 Tax=Clostridium sp. TaxID=1506 RepID=UPI002A85AD49|nr:minor capsid protein [Clostridium sp.]MDY5098517.1 minor capsid protein [Clostridium sp.]
MDREKFLEELYKSSEEELKEVYKRQNINMRELLNEIAMILLTYTIVDNVLNLNNKQKNTLYKGLSSKILNMFSNETKETTKKVDSILSKVAKDNLESYGIKSHQQEVLDIINRNLDGKHYSDRIWDNENDVSKRLHKEVKDFLDGKVNANQIKSHIEKQFDANKYNVSRLVDTEIARVESDITEKYFRDYGIKKVKYNACLCNTCDRCMNDHEKIFDVDDPNRPRLPRHPQCKCFYVQEDDEKHLVMNLQLFAKKSNWEILRSQINSGILDENEAKNGMKYWEKAIKKEIVTPIEVINKSRKSIDQYWHILEDHKEFLNPSNIDEIVESLKNPDEIRLSFGKNVYIKNIKGKDLIVIVNSDIITAYYPNKRYLNNIKKKVLLWRK